MPCMITGNPSALVHPLLFRTDWCSGVILIDNEQSLWIWIKRIIHCYERCIPIAVTSQIQRGIGFASEHCLAPVIVGYKNGTACWSRLK